MNLTTVTNDLLTQLHDRLKSFQVAEVETFIDSKLKSTCASDNFKLLRLGRPTDEKLSSLDEVTRTGTTVWIRHPQNELKNLVLAHKLVKDTIQGEFYFVLIYTPPSSPPGFNMHVDEYDLILCGLNGQKIFHLRQDNGEVSKVLLETGHTFLLKKGIPHFAINVGSSPSLHLSIGLM